MDQRFVELMGHEPAIIPSVVSLWLVATVFFARKGFVVWCQTFACLTILIASWFVSDERLMMAFIGLLAISVGLDRYLDPKLVVRR